MRAARLRRRSPASDLRADMAGVFSGMNGGDAIVTLWNGVTVRGR